MFEEKDYNSDVDSEIESVNETKNEEKVIEDVESDDNEEYNDKDSDVEDDDDLEENDDELEDFENENPGLDALEGKKRPTIFAEPEDEDEDEDNDDEDYLQKFDDSLRKQIIQDFHPELKTHNYDEIETLSRVVRDNYGNIVDPFHKTLPFITKYEKTRILGERASQINSGAKPLINVDPDMIDGYVIALKEYEAKKIPFILKRPLPNGAVEYWKFEDLELI
jgi:DNA-directed RNA polymerase subunit K/omega